VTIRGLTLVAGVSPATETRSWQIIFLSLNRFVAMKSFGSPLLAFIFLPVSVLPFFGPQRTSATLSWDPSPDKRIVSYRIYYTDMTKTKAAKAKSIDVGRTTQATVSNLVAGHTYYFVVRALDQAGRESEPSNLVKHIAGSRPSNSK
jgi:Fibronectin type III domain